MLFIIASVSVNKCSVYIKINRNEKVFGGFFAIDLKLAIDLFSWISFLDLTDVAHELLNRGATVGSALFEAIGRANPSIFDRLLDLGASPSAHMGCLSTLHLAATLNDDTFMERLLSYPQVRSLVNEAQPDPDPSSAIESKTPIQVKRNRSSLKISYVNLLHYKVYILFTHLLIFMRPSAVFHVKSRDG